MLKKIIVADDESDLETLLRQRFRKQIREKQIEFFFAKNGVEALVHLATHPDADLLLSDINMPEMDGLTLLGKVSVLAPALKTVMVSAYGDLSNIRTAMNRGAFDFVTKPINFDDLDITIEKAFRHAAQDKVAFRTAQELGVARELQTYLLPKTAPPSARFDLAGTCEPATAIGGDYFDFFVLPNRKLALAIADVSGKGVPAAIYMTLVKGILQACACERPLEALVQTNAHLHRLIKRGSFVSMLYAVLDAEKNTLTYARAGHPPPIFIAEDDRRNLPLKTKGIALGLVDSPVFTGMIAETTIELRPDDVLVFYTDGFSEAMNPLRHELGDERLRQFAYTHSAKPASSDILAAICKQVSLFTDSAPQHDDMTMVVLKVKA